MLLPNIVKNLKVRVLSWKNKAIQGGKELRAARKRIQELVKSRATWKKKYQAVQQELAILKAKKEPSKVQAKTSTPVSRHHYDLETISFCLRLRNTGTISLRNCVKVLDLLVATFNLPLGVPSINSIRNWEHKYGYYKLQKSCENEDEYMVIIDESFCIAKQTILLLLGVNLSKYDFTKPLCFEDIELLGMNIQSSWKGDEIAAEIASIQERGYHLLYSCSDGASNIKNALNTSDLERISDCTHAFSKIIEKRYKNDPDFIGFTKACALLNRQNYMGKDAAICPPKQRSKARFLNIKPLTKWAIKTLELVEKLDALKTPDEDQARMCTKLQWLKEYQPLIKMLSILVNEIEVISKHLKTKGLTQNGIEEIKIQIEKTDQLPCFFKEQLVAYLEDNSRLCAQYEQLICNSDIIESYFGKFKSQQSKNPDKGITINSLRITHYGGELEEDNLKKSLEKIKLLDLEHWKDKSGLKTFVAKKRNLYQKVG